MQDLQSTCPVDGQTLEWHVKTSGKYADGTPRMNGDILGCGFITPEDRDELEMHIQRGIN